MKNKLTQNEHVHFHPSGELSPSQEDKEVTKRLIRAGKILNIPVIDHIIIGKSGYFSFKEGGYMDSC